MKISISSDSLNDLCEEALALGFFSDERPPRGLCGLLDWHLNGLISRAIAGEKITGSFMEKVLIQLGDRLMPPTILLVGLGTREALTYERMYQAGGIVFSTLSDIQCCNFAAQTPETSRCGLAASHMALAFASGLIDASESVHNNSNHHSQSIHILGEDHHMDDIVAGIRQCPAVIEGRIPVETGKAKHCASGALPR